MAVSFPPFYTCQILGPDGKPVAGGVIRAYYTGSEVPAPLFAPDGTPLGSSVSIDAAGNAVFCLRVGTTYRLRCIDADGAVVWTRDGVRALGETAGIENPMTGAGDMIVGAAGGEPARLAPGAEGDALKIVNGVPAWSTDEEGMQNPMTTAGDLIVGSAGGAPARLGVGTDGDILATGNGAPTWEGGPKKYRNVYQNIPSPQIDDGYLGCLFYLSGSAQALTLPATANVPSKSFIDFVFLDGTATLTITPQGTTTLNEQATAVTIGGQSATLYRLTFLGHGGSGDEWALGGSGNGDHKVSADGTDAAGYLEDKIGAGSGISLATSAGKVVVSADTQPGDHKTAVDGADASPDYLANKLSAGTGITLTNTGSAVEIAATAQSGDHQLLVSATDAAAGYLGAKLTAGSNVTLTPQTDGDGVQTLEISATGGGGGGSAKGILLPWGAMVPGWFVVEGITSGKTFCIFGRTALRNCTIKKVLIGTFGADTMPSVNELGVYAMRSNRALTLLGKTTTCSIVGGGEMMFEFTAPLSVGDEIIFLSHLCGATYLSTKVAYIRSVVSGALYNPTLPPNLGTTYAIDSANTGSRLGFVWGDRTIQSLPASTTPSDWNYNYNYLPIPYTEVFYE